MHLVYPKHQVIGNLWQTGAWMGGMGTEVAEHTPLVSPRLQPDPKGLWGGGQPAVAPPRGQGYLYLASGKRISEPSAPHPAALRVYGRGNDTPTEESAEEHRL